MDSDVLRCITDRESKSKCRISVYSNENSLAPSMIEMNKCNQLDQCNQTSWIIFSQNDAISWTIPWKFLSPIFQLHFFQVLDYLSKSLAYAHILMLICILAILLFR